MIRTRLTLIIVSAAAVVFSGAVGASPADETQGREAQLKRIVEGFQADRDALFKALRDGRIKTKDGVLPEFGELQGRVADEARRFIEVNPADQPALDAILFSMQQLVADQSNPKLYEYLLQHHLDSPKLGIAIGRPCAPDELLKAAADKSPHLDVRARARLAIAERLDQQGRHDEAQRMLEELAQSKELADAGGAAAGVRRAAEKKLFEVQHLSVGKTAPGIEGVDMDDRPMKLSDYRGKVVYLVFWATWCGPCMAMVPHERDLTKRFEGRPFAVVGVNGDAHVTFGPNNEQIDEKSKVKAIIKREGITWRSFQNGPQLGIVDQWNVSAWPTVYLIDHEGVIRQKFSGSLGEGPGRDALEAEIERLVSAAQADRDAGSR